MKEVVYNPAQGDQAFSDSFDKMIYLSKGEGEILCSLKLPQEEKIVHCFVILKSTEAEVYQGVSPQSWLSSSLIDSLRHQEA